MRYWREIIVSTLYELTGTFNQVAERLEEEDPAVLDTLESLDMAIEDKADGYAKMIRNEESRSDALNEEIKRLKQRKQAIDNNVKRMKESLQNCMLDIGKTKFKTDLFSFGIQKNPARVEITDEELIPDEYKKYKVEYDKKAIKEAKEVPGAEIKQSESLRIR